MDQFRSGRCDELRTSPAGNSLLFREASDLTRCRTQEVVGFWNELYRQTIITAQIDQEGVLAAFGLINSIIDDNRAEYWQRRLAHVRFADVLQEVGSVIASNKPAGQDGGRRATSLLLDLLSDSLRQPSHCKRSRKALYNRIRTAKRWTKLLDGSIFLLLGLSERADALM